jgi:hypothetical protein
MSTATATKPSSASMPTATMMDTAPRSSRLARAISRRIAWPPFP